MMMPAMVRFLFGVLRRVLSRVLREALVTAALHALATRLMRVLMEWACCIAGSAVMSEALIQAMRQAMG
jgi:hypothetical protein